MNDLKNIDFYLSEAERIINIPAENKEMIRDLRLKIASTMDLVSVMVRE